MLCKTLSYLSCVTETGGWLFSGLVVWSFSGLVVWLFGCLATPPNRLTVVWSFGRLVS